MPISSAKMKTIFGFSPARALEAQNPPTNKMISSFEALIK